MEQKILAACIASREAYQLSEVAKIKKELSDKGEIIYEAISEYYTIDEAAASVDLQLIQDRIVAKYPKHEALFKAALGSLPEISVANIKVYLIGLRRSKIKTKLASMFTQEGNDKEIAELLEKYHDTLEDIEEDVQEARVFHNVDISELVNKFSKDAKIQLSPPIINEVVEGGLLRKHHVLMFGRPDMGKTTHWIEMAYGFLRQNLVTLVVGNEDPPEDITVRMMTRLTGMTRAQIVQEPDRARDILAKRNWDKFIFVEMTPGTPREITEVVDKFRPDVLIVDQSRNLNLGNVEGVQQLERAERFIRNIGKQYNMLTISLTQAGDSAHNKLVLEMNDIDGSKTGMQASADLMIGIGANEDYLISNQRMLSFPKNKLGSDKQPRRVSVDFSINKVV